MAQRDGLESGGRRLGARERVEALAGQRARDGAQPVGPLGMAGRGEVFEAGRMGDEQRGHGAFAVMLSGCPPASAMSCLGEGRRSLDSRSAPGAEAGLRGDFEG